MSEFKVVLTERERIETPVWVPRGMRGEIRVIGEWLLASVYSGIACQVQLDEHEWVEPDTDGNGMTIHRHFDMNQIVEAEEWVDARLDIGYTHGNPTTVPEPKGMTDIAYVWLDEDGEEHESTVTMPIPCDCPVCGTPVEVPEDALTEFDDGDKIAYQVICQECGATTGITEYQPENENAHVELLHEAFGKWNRHELYWRFS